MKFIKYISSIVFFFIAFANYAQEKKIEIEIGGGYGLSGLSGKLDNGNITPGMGSHLSLNGKYFFSSTLGVGIDVGYASYSAKAELTNYTFSISSVDDENENFDYRISANGIEEKLKLSAFEIPLFIAYRKNFSERIKLTGRAGLMFSVPLSATYECSKGTIETRGYYPAYNVELFDLPNHGFEKTENISYSGKLAVSTACSFFAGAGISVPVGNIGINVFIYGSYGLSPILNAEKSQLIIYPNKYQSVISLADKVTLISGGIGLGVCL